MTLIAEAPRTTDLEAIFGLCPKRRRRDLVEATKERIMKIGVFYQGAVGDTDMSALIEIARLVEELETTLIRHCGQLWE